MILTLRQRRFIKRYFETMSATQAAYDAYDVKNKNVAGAIDWESRTIPELLNGFIRKKFIKSVII